MPWKLIPRLALVALFGGSGIIHLTDPGFYRPIMPLWLPAPVTLIYISGVCELLGALGLLAPQWPAARLVTRYGLVALLVAVFPANVQMAINGFSRHASPLVLTLEIARLPLQPLLILLVLAATRPGPIPAEAPQNV